MERVDEVLVIAVVGRATGVFELRAQLLAELGLGSLGVVCAGWLSFVFRMTVSASRSGLIRVGEVRGSNPRGALTRLGVPDGAA